MGLSLVCWISVWLEENGLMGKGSLRWDGDYGLKGEEGVEEKGLTRR